MWQTLNGGRFIRLDSRSKIGSRGPLIDHFTKIFDVSFEESWRRNAVDSPTASLHPPVHRRSELHEDVSLLIHCSSTRSDEARSELNTLRCHRKYFRKSNRNLFIDYKIKSENWPQLLDKLRPSRNAEMRSLEIKLSLAMLMLSTTDTKSALLCWLLF